jgi:hypothetical protein
MMTGAADDLVGAGDGPDEGLPARARLAVTML